MKVQDVIAVMGHVAPPHFACDWDKAIGLQLGDREHSVKKILVSLDITPNVVGKALRDHADMIIAHHALFFDPLTQIDMQTPMGKKIQQLIKNNIAVFIAHTNLDAAPQGVNFWLARREGLDPAVCQVMEVTYTEELCKFVVFVPYAQVDAVRSAISEAGAGHIGNYSHCTFNLKGLGTFLPHEGASPFIGKKGTLETVDEVRIETIVPRARLSGVIEAMKKVHPYEEVAYDIYPLSNAGIQYGMGLIGDLAKPKMIGGKKVKRLAVCGGGAGSLIKKAYDMGAEAFILGECSYHDMLYAKELGLPVIAKGHFETEALVVRPLAHMLQKLMPQLKVSAV